MSEARSVVRDEGHGGVWRRPFPKSHAERSEASGPAGTDRGQATSSFTGAAPRSRPGRIVVAGYGNPLRGDDGAGWQVAQAVEARWCPAAGGVDGDEVLVLSGQHPLPEWAPLLAEADIAYFVDAAPISPATPASALEAGGHARAHSVRLTRLWPPGPAADLPGQGDGLQAAAESLGGHALGPQALLTLARALYGHAPEAYLIAIPATQFSFQETLSPDTAAAVEAAVALVDRLIEERLDQLETYPNPSLKGGAPRVRTRPTGPSLKRNERPLGRLAQCSPPPFREGLG